MNTMTEMKNLAVQAGKVRMTPSEAFVETLVAQGFTDTFGLVGPAPMDATGWFPLAGVPFISGATGPNAELSAAMLNARTHLAVVVIRIPTNRGVPSHRQRRSTWPCRATSKTSV